MRPSRIEFDSLAEGPWAQPPPAKRDAKAAGTTVLNGDALRKRLETEQHEPASRQLLLDNAKGDSPSFCARLSA